MTTERRFVSICSVLFTIIRPLPVNVYHDQPCDLSWWVSNALRQNSWVKTLLEWNPNRKQVLTSSRWAVSGFHRTRARWRLFRPVSSSLATAKSDGSYEKKTSKKSKRNSNAAKRWSTARTQAPRITEHLHSSTHQRQRAKTVWQTLLSNYHTDHQHINCTSVGGSNNMQFHTRSRRTRMRFCYSSTAGQMLINKRPGRSKTWSWQVHEAQNSPTRMSEENPAPCCSVPVPLMWLIIYKAHPQDDEGPHRQDTWRQKKETTLL